MMLKKAKQEATAKYPGTREAMDGSEAVVAMETAGSEGAGAYPITPSTQMGEGWAAAVAAGRHNVNGRKLIFFEPEGEHAAAAVTAGMSMTGLRATNFSSGQGIAYMHESLYAAVGKRLTYVLNIACRAMTKHALNVHAGHDDYHAIDDTGFFQLFGKNVQETADLNLIAHRIAELALTPGVCAQDGFLTSHVIESVMLPERELVKEYLGDPSDIIESPTPAQRMVFGEKRRRIPEMFDLDYPAMIGVVQNQDSYAQGVAAQRPFYFDHVQALTDQAMEEFFQLTGRRYERATGYRLDDAEIVILGQGSMVWNAEAVADHMRDEHGVKVGVVNVTMFRPFPADILTKLLRGKKSVVVLERTDQPLAVDLPLVREIRAAMAKGVENGRAKSGSLPHPGLAALKSEEVPEFFSGVYGLGSRDLQPGDLIAAVKNAMPEGDGRRLFYLGIDFVRKGTRLPKLQIWQEKLLESYPDISHLALDSAGNINLMPKDSVSFRIHSVGGWGAITTGKNVAMTAFELLGWHIKANPKYGSEKKGQPTTFYGTLAKEAIRLNSELKHVDVVLSPDPNVFRHSNPLAGLSEGGAFVIQSDLTAEQLWDAFPAGARREIREKDIKVYFVDGFKIASDEASDPELRYRMQGAAFMGAFFRTAGLMEREGLDEHSLFEGIRKQLQKKFGHLGERVVEDNVRVIKRGFDETSVLGAAAMSDEGAEAAQTPQMPAEMDGEGWRDGIGNPGRFWEQVAHLYKSGDEPIADPFAAISAIPAATSTIRDMTDVRFEVPEFVPENCTGCSQCWVVCPDAAIPGMVNTVEQILDAAIASSSNGRSFDKLRQISKHVANESRRIMKGVPVSNFADIVSQAYKQVVDKLGWDAEKRAQLDEEFAPVYSALAEFPIAKTAPFYDLPESQEKGTGGLLSITVSPTACKGCNLCVEVCPDKALITVKQDDEVVEKLRRNWKMWEWLPDTDDRYINIANLDEGIGVLSSLLLKKENYRSMFGGDGSCMGCGEKTGIHLILAAVNAVMQPRVEKHVKHIEELIAGLDAKARELLASEADLDSVSSDDSGEVDVPLEKSKRTEVERIAEMIRDLKDLHWRYKEGPSGKGRSVTGFTNATGCSSVWGSTYPYNPYPFPWTNHLFQDAPSIAIGIFEGHMRKMSDGFIAIRRAELEVSGEYKPETDEPFFSKFDWRQFSDEEFKLCPPIFAVGGDGAMMDIGFQNASRLMASGKPIRIIVLDTQVYSNTGGQACTSGFTGQVSDMAAFGKDQHGKEETRKEMALLAMAHRGTFVLQSSQALPSHLLAGVIQGLNSRRPAVFVLHCPCPPEHGLGDDQATQAAKLSLESRAFPFLVYDPDGGPSLADCINLDGNPDQDETWPSYELKYVDDEGAEQVMELPMTIADWAATEARFKKHFKGIPADADDDGLIPFHEYVAMPKEERNGERPFIYSIGPDKKLRRVSVSDEIVELAEDRLLLWNQLREMDGQVVSDDARGVVEAELETEFEEKVAALRAEYEAKLADLRTRYPQFVARRMAEGLLRAGNGDMTVTDLLTKAAKTTGLQPLTMDVSDLGGGAPAPAGDGGVAVADAPPAPTSSPAPAAVEEEEGEEALAMEPYIETLRCTSCNECTNLNKKLFAYDDKKQAFIKDAKAGTFREIVMAAERCPVKIIHPGTPLNPKEKDLEKWLKRAEPFN
jgi:pyruvate-ferredoxin/flavodoxin oxidoreductase